MKLGKYLREDTDHILKDGPKIWKTLLRDSKSFLKELEKARLAGKMWLWRGSDKRMGDRGIMSVKPRRDRWAKDMPPDLHLKFDEEFYNLFRWSPRSEGVFATSKRSIASQYGQPYLFFPIGKFKFIWSPQIDDLYSLADGENMLAYGSDDYYGYYDEYEIERQWEENYGEESGNGLWEYDGEEVGDYRSSHAEAEQEAIERVGDEEYDWSLLQWVPEVTLEDFMEEKNQEEQERIENEIDNAVRTYKAGDFRGAIRSGHEVTFDVKEYYLVSPRFKDFISEMINHGVYQLKLPFPPFGTTTPPKYWAYNKKGMIIYNDPIK